MTQNEIASTTETNPGWFRQGWRFLTAAHPLVTDIGEQRRAQLLAVLALVLVLGYSLALSMVPPSADQFVGLLILSLISYGLSRSRFYHQGTYFFTFTHAAFAYFTLLLGTSNSYISTMTTIVHISLILGSILLPVRGLITMVVFIAIASLAAPYYAQTPVVTNADFYKHTGVAIVTGIILVGSNIFRASIERVRLFQIYEVNQKLEQLASTLEQRVDERTAELEKANLQTMQRAKQLRAVTELSESISQLQDLNEIFPAVTRLISERFGFYHVGIFLVEHERAYAILQAANSEGGQRMLRRGHRLQLGVGVVGVCAERGLPRIALDVGSDLVWFNNPDLPETRSEVALPLKARGQTIGVLDVQSTEAGAFSNEDLEVLTALANQISIALENARLLTEARAAYTQVQEVYNEFTRAEWSRTISQTEQAGFRYQTGRIEMLENRLKNPEVIQAIQQGETTASRPNGHKSKPPVLAVPVKLRGEVIGILNIESQDSGRQWQDDEVSLVQAVAERAAFAMENARLFQDARRRAAKERLISDATARISSAFNVENILQTAAEELERVLGGSEISIRFQTKEPS